MGRFDPAGPSPEHEHAHAESVAEKLRANVEREVRAVVDEAMARALAIEDRALVEASKTEQESQQRASEILRESGERASAVLDVAAERAERLMEATHTLEGELAKVITSFRGEIDVLKQELESAKAELLPPSHAPSSDLGPIRAADPVPEPTPPSPAGHQGPSPSLTPADAISNPAFAEEAPHADESPSRGDAPETDDDKTRRRRGLLRRK